VGCERGTAKHEEEERLIFVVIAPKFGVSTPASGVFTPVLDDTTPSLPRKTGAFRPPNNRDKELEIEDRDSNGGADKLIAPPIVISKI
jgi:hypothetical protein